MTAVHASPFAGLWYSGDRAELSGLLDELFDRSRTRTGPFLLPDARAFVVPHAGLVYSGTVAAAAYRYVEQQRPRRLVILGFAHRGAPGGVLLPRLEAISTPLGEVAVDAEAVQELAAAGFELVDERYLCDHSIEIQLPLVQRAAPDARIVAIYVGSLDSRLRSEAARRLAALVSPDTIFLASSDFTHYGREFDFRPFPPDDQVERNLRQLDESAMEAAGSLESRLFLETLRETGSNVCGSGPIALLLETLSAAPGSEIFQEALDYQTSGQITGDFRHSVSYGALGYFPAESFAPTDSDQNLLLESARQTLNRLIETGERKCVHPSSRSAGLARRAGVFVSLHRGGELRGCVGTRASSASLYDVVPEMTLSAALDDLRFEPVQTGERNLDIEISVLSPMKRISDRSRFRVGVHGAYLEAGYHRGLLLPQVAEGRDWGVEKFLETLAYKAGVRPKVYGDPATKLYVFRAQVFGETHA